MNLSTLLANLIASVAISSAYDVGTYDYCADEKAPRAQIANLDLTVGSPFRPDIDGFISNNMTNYTDWPGWTSGVNPEYANFTTLRMYIAGKPQFPYVGNAYLAHGEGLLFAIYLSTPFI